MVFGTTFKTKERWHEEFFINPLAGFSYATQVSYGFISGHGVATEFSSLNQCIDSKASKYKIAKIQYQIHSYWLNCQIKLLGIHRVEIQNDINYISSCCLSIDVLGQALVRSLAFKLVTTSTNRCAKPCSSARTCAEAKANATSARAAGDRTCNSLSWVPSVTMGGWTQEVLGLKTIQLWEHLKTSVGIRYTSSRMIDLICLFLEWPFFPEAAHLCHVGMHGRS